MPSCWEKSCTTTEEERQRVHRPQETHPYVYPKIGLFTWAGQFINHKSASVQLTSREAYRTCAEDWHARPGVTECFVNLGSKCFLPRVKLPTCTAMRAELQYFLFPCDYIALLLLLCYDFIRDAPNAGLITYSADNIHACELYFKWMPNIVSTFHNNCHQKHNKLCQAPKQGEVVFLSVFILFTPASMHHIHLFRPFYVFCMPHINCTRMLAHWLGLNQLQPCHDTTCGVGLHLSRFELQIFHNSFALCWCGISKMLFSSSCLYFHTAMSWLFIAACGIPASTDFILTSYDTTAHNISHPDPFGRADNIGIWCRSWSRISVHLNLSNCHQALTNVVSYFSPLNNMPCSSVS